MMPFRVEQCVSCTTLLSSLVPLMTRLSLLWPHPTPAHRVPTSQLFMEVPLLLPCKEAGQAGLPYARISQQYHAVEGLPGAFRVTGFRGPATGGRRRLPSGRIEGGRLAQPGMLGFCRRCCTQEARLVAPGGQGQWSAGSPAQGGLCFLLGV